MSSSGLSDATVIAIAQEALMTTLMIAAPILVVSLLIGVTISIFQAMTQVNEVTMTFVPKIFGVFAVAALFGPWMIGTMVNYTTRLFSTLPQVAQ